MPVARPAAALLAAAIAATAPPAAAAEARASGDVPVRAHPWTAAAVVGSLADGAFYEVEDCTRRARWCLVAADGFALGWVRGSYLVGAGAKNRVTPFEFLVAPDFEDMLP